MRVVLDSGESLTVQLVDGEVEIGRDGHWRQRLRREEAWRLAEALDEVATAADEY